MLQCKLLFIEDMQVLMMQLLVCFCYYVDSMKCAFLFLLQMHDGMLVVDIKLCSLFVVTANLKKSDFAGQNHY